MKSGTRILVTGCEILIWNQEKLFSSHTLKPHLLANPESVSLCDSAERKASR
mgnify:CR=1 FL=1